MVEKPGVLRTLLSGKMLRMLVTDSTGPGSIGRYAVLNLIGIYMLGIKSALTHPTVSKTVLAMFSYNQGCYA